MGDLDDLRIEILEEHEDDEVRAMLVDLALGEQQHFDHPAESPEQLTERLRPSPHFRGDNHILVARAAGGRPVGLCWIVLFDPGTGLEAEVAELYVRPEGRGQGVAHRLMAEAMDVLREREVTFACVWTRGDNPAALAAYQAAGFAPTEQTVLTWLPIA
ncbi:MAG: GNAT family N-acetyltransferase [Candidatus Dormiibacterota bacterium]